MQCLATRRNVPDTTSSGMQELMGAGARRISSGVRTLRTCSGVPVAAVVQGIVYLILSLEAGVAGAVVPRGGLTLDIV